MMSKTGWQVAGVSILCVASAFGQGGAPQGPPTSPLSSTLERNYAAGSSTPMRQVQTRSESNGREIITETTEVPGLDGKLKPSLQTTTETVRTGAGSTQIKRDVLAPDAQGRMQLSQTTQTDVQSLPDGSSRRVANTFVPDVNGRLGLSSREIQETKSPSPNVKQTDTSIFLPGLNQAEVESERLQQVERKVASDVTQKESTRYFRNPNGQWQATETRNEEVRTTGSERVAEETVQRLNEAGALTVSEKKVTRQSKSNGQEETTTESYSANTPGGLASSTGRLQLDQRVRVTTSTAAGSQQTIREVEGRRPGSPNEPLRVIERTVETLRQTGPDRWELQREVFALDGNGRLVPVSRDSGAAVGR